MMEKRIWLFLLAFAAVLVLGLFFRDFISASIFDALVAVSLNITVVSDTTPPDLIVDSPTSTTYTTSSVDINYSVLEPESSVDTVWYNLNSEANATLTANITRTLSDGSYNFYIYANNTAGLVNDSESVSFTVSAAAPPPAAPAPGVSGGGGLAGRAVKEVVSFEVDRDLIKITLRQGDIKTELLKIKNTGDRYLDMVIDLKNLEEFVIFPGGVSVYNFRLNPDEERTVQLIFNVARDKKPGVYPGQIIVKADSLQKLITTIVEVESEKPLFDIDVEVLPDDKQVFPGESVSAEIKLFNLLGRRRVDVTIEHGIKDLEGNTVVSGSSIVAVETQASFVRSLVVPFNLGSGSYVFYVTATYDSTTSTSSDLFEVLEKPAPVFIGLSTIQLVILAVICLIILFIALALRDVFIHLKKARKEKISPWVVKPKKEKEFKERKPEKEVEKLKKQLRVLEESYKSGLLSEEAYNEDKGRIEKLLKEFKGEPEKAEEVKKVEVKEEEEKAEKVAVKKKPEEKKEEKKFDLMENIKKLRERMR